MKILVLRKSPRAKSELLVRAENVNAAATLLQELHVAGAITDETFTILSRAVSAEVTAVARELRA